MKARDVMTRGVVSVTPDCTIQELASGCSSIALAACP